MPEDWSEQLRMIRESRLYAPDPERARRTHAGSVAAWEQLLRQSQTDPEAFWDGVASELTWYRRWDTTMEGSLPHFRFFSGGISNPCVNLLDRHLEQGADNRLALIWEGENGESRFFTYRMLLAEVNRCANALRGFGVGKGDGVAMFLPNLAETVIAVLACYRLGAHFNTIFSGFSARALRNRLETYEPKVVITADAGYRRGALVPLKEKIDGAIEGIDSVRAVIVVKRAGLDVPMRPGRDHWWQEALAGQPLSCQPEPVEANDPGIVFFTSGTTGKPKGIVHAGMAFVVNNYVYTKYHMDHHPHDVLWCIADVGWLTMHIWGIVGALVNGVTTLFYEGAIDYPGPQRVYEIIAKYRVNKVFTTPTAIRMLMRYGEALAAPHDLSSLEVIALVGEPFNPEAWHWAYENLGHGRVYINNTWGQTETAGCPLAGAAWLTPMKPGSCGPAYLGAELDVVDDDGQPVPANVPGNLIIRQPIPMMVRTLWKEPERYLQTYFSQVPGAYFTHDAAVRDDDGHFWVIGRVDDVFNVAGHRLSTMEMESAVLECEGVAEAAVIGVPDAVKGEVPAVFAILRSGHAPSAELAQRIRRQVAESIGKIATPEYVYFTDAMPKTASGKILRRLLKEIVLKGDVQGDVTGLEDPAMVERVKQVVRTNWQWNQRNMA